MKRLLFIVLVVFPLLMSKAASAGTRDFLNFQGMLFNADGDVIDGTTTMTFRFYGESTGGAPLWEEIQSVDVSGGVYTVALGSGAFLEDSLFNNDSLFLGLQIEKDNEMTPRLEVGSVTWAKQAEVALTAKSLDNDAVQALIARLPAGPAGTNGAAGPQGASGAPGLSGSQGPQGDPTTVTAGNGLTGGGSGATVTLNVGAGAGMNLSADAIGIADLGVTDAMAQDNLTIAGGTVDNSVIGGTTPAAGTFTTLTVDGTTMTPEVFARKASDSCIGNNVACFVNDTAAVNSTLTNDPDLKLPVAVNQVLQVDGYMDALNANGTPDIKSAFTIPAGATMTISYHSIDTAGSVGAALFTSSGTPSTNALASNTHALLYFRGVVVNGANAGDIQFQWAQNTGDTTAGRQTIVKAGSYLKGSVFP